MDELESRIRKELMPFVSRTFAEFITEMANDRYEELCEKFNCGCSGAELKQSVEDWMGENSLVTPSNHMFSNLICTTSAETTYRSNETSLEVTNDTTIELVSTSDLDDEFYCEMHLWHKSLQETDVSLTLVVTMDNNTMPEVKSAFVKVL